MSEADPQNEDTQPDPAEPVDGSPATDEPTDGSQAESQDTTDWKSRYENLQPEFTRASQEAAELRQYRDILAAAQQGDPQAQKWIAEQVGWEIEEGEEPEDEIEQFLDPRVDQLLQHQAEQQHQAELQSLESHVDGEIDKLARSAGIEDLSTDAKDLIFAALTPGQDGNPDVAKAFKKVTGLSEAAIKDYVAGKRRPPQAPSGSSPSHQPDLDDDEQRRQYILSRIGQ